MAHPKSPFSLSVGPAKQTLTHGQAQVTVTDSGTKPMSVHTEVLRLAGAHCGQAQNLVTVNPNRFQLQPGHSLVTAVHLVPATPAGDYGVLYLAQVTGAHRGVTLTGSVGSQVLVKGAAVCHPVASALPPAGGFPLLWLVVGLVALVLAVVGTAAWLRRRA